MPFYQHDSPAAFRFQVIGAFREASAREMEGCWNTAAAVIGARPLVVDLREVSEWDAHALDLLGRMHLQGARFVGRPGRPAQLIGLVTGAAVELEEPLARQSPLTLLGRIQRYYGIGAAAKVARRDAV